MYNRYIPQPDGTYRRNRVPEQSRPSTGPKRAPCPPPRKEETSVPHEKQESHCSEPTHQKDIPCRTPPCKQGGSALGFLKNLLPKDFDTGDLLIVLLLLLMAGDSAEDENNALLTLALYLFM